MKGVIKKTLKSKKAEGYVDSGVKILIAVVIGALLLGGIYMLFKDTILPTAQSKVESLFDYAGEVAEVEEVQPNTIAFCYASTNYEAEEGMTWSEWLDSKYNTTSLSVKKSGYVGRDDGNGAGLSVYYSESGSKKYVKADDLIVPNKYYQVQINMPIIMI